MQFCVTPASCGGVCVVLPREVAVIEAANLNGMPVNVQGPWGQFIRPHLSWNQCSNQGIGLTQPCTDIQNFRCGCGCGCAGVPQMVDEGLVPCFATTSAGDRIKLYALQASDYGKKVVVQGRDSNGLWVRTSFDGAVQDGEQVTLAAGGVLTTTQWAVGNPYAVYKEETDYNVTMFADNGTSERQLASYEPSETNPSYRKVRLPGVRCPSSGCGRNITVRAMVSLESTPITGENDWLLFQGSSALSAYSDGILAEKLYENGDVAQGDAYMFGIPKPARNARGVLRVAVGNGAIPLLESELRKQTGDRTTVRVQRDGLSLQGFV